MAPARPKSCTSMASSKRSKCWLLAVSVTLAACQTPPARFAREAPESLVAPAEPEAALSAAIGQANCTDVQKFLDAAPLSSRQRMADAALLRSTFKGLPACVAQLLEAGANANAALPDGSTALWLAARQGAVEIVDTLLAHGAAVNQANRSSVAPLAVAAGEGRRDATRALIQTGAELEHMSSRQWTALHHAVAGCHPEIAAQLLDAGANVDARDRQGTSALLIGAAVCPTAVAVLLEHRADINATEAQGMNALMVAAQNSQQQTVALLLRQGADPNLRDQRGRSFQDWARLAGKEIP